MLLSAFLVMTVLSGDTITESDNFTASDVAQGDKFGFSLARSGETLVVCSYAADSAAAECGAAYVYTGAPNFTQVAKLFPADGAIGDHFGYSCAIDQGTLVVGSRDDDDLGGNSGSVYVYTGAGASWTQQAKLTASDGEAVDLFGADVAIDGDTIVVGAYGDDDQGSAAGAAYVFVRSGATWTEQAKLLAPDGQALDNYGRSVAIDGDTVVVGSIGDNLLGSNSGSVYIYTRTGTTWTYRVELHSSDGATSDNFGKSLALQNGTLAVGTPGDDDFGATCGSAYVFVGSGASWTELVKLTASDASAGAQFGESIDLDGSRIVVGAWNEWHVTSGAGSAYEFRFTGSTWEEARKLIASDAAVSDNFGGAVALAGGTVVVSAENDDPVGNNSGSAYFFELALGTAFCFGDGSAMPCPCGNFSAVGAQEGCLNSLGRGVRLEGAGGLSVGADDLELVAQGLPSFALAFCGTIPMNGGSGTPFGDGLRCAGGSIVRLGVAFPDVEGNARWGPGIGSFGGWAAGDTRYFQIWYRDPSGPCGSNFNVSNGLELVFEP